MKHAVRCLMATILTLYAWVPSAAEEFDITQAHQVGFLNCEDALDIHLRRKEVSQEVRFHVDQYFKNYTRHQSFSVAKAERHCAASGQSISIHTAMVSQ